MKASIRRIMSRATKFFGANGARLCRRPAAARGQRDRHFKYAVLRLVEDDTAALRTGYIFPLLKSNESKHPKNYVVRPLEHRWPQSTCTCPPGLPRSRASERESSGVASLGFEIRVLMQQ